MSFVIFAVSALAIKELRYAQYGPDNCAIAAAVSHVVYHAPIGAVYTGVATPLVFLPSASLENDFEQVANGSAKYGDLWKVNPDGNGFAYTLFATMAMQIFGVHLESLTIAFLALLGVSTLAFILRYRDDRLVVVPLYFLALTISLFSLITLPVYVGQIFIGGMRYFAVLGILPALHLFWEIVEAPENTLKVKSASFGLMSVQLLLLLFSVLTRGSTFYIVLSLLCICVVTMLLYRKNTLAFRRLGRSLFAMLAVVVLLFSAFYISVPSAYRHSGRINGVFWHRAIISLGANPAWPFGNLREVYSSCKAFSQRMASGIDDANGGCIYGAYALKHGLPLGTMDLYTGKYEAVLRGAFFDILRAYPKETLEAIFYYKPLLIIDTLKKLFSNFHVPGKTPSLQLFLRILLAVQAGISFVFFVMGLQRTSLRRLLLLAAVFPVFMAFLMTTYLMAWSTVHTSVEILLYAVLFAGILVAAATNAVRERWWARRPEELSCLTAQGIQIMRHG